MPSAHPSQQAGGNANDAINSVLRLLRKQLVRLPAVSGDADGEVYLSSELKKALQAAAKLQKKKGDSFLGEQQDGQEGRRLCRRGRRRVQALGGAGVEMSRWLRR